MICQIFIVKGCYHKKIIEKMLFIIHAAALIQTFQIVRYFATRHQLCTLLKIHRNQYSIDKTHIYILNNGRASPQLRMQLLKYFSI